MRPPLLLSIVTVVSGCALVRAPIIDDPTLDAGDRPDIPGLDAPPIDTPIADAPLPPTDRGDCAATDTTCDHFDDDCDGTADNTGCSIGATCVPITIGGVAYQSCPAVTGIDAWSGACRRMGMGYELARFEDAVAQDAVRSRLATLGIGGPHWIAANDFRASGSYVWWNGATSPPVPLAPGEAEDPSHRCVAFQNDGFYTQLRCEESQRVLCAADVGRRRCAAGDEEPCNGLDDDCDGDVDEGDDCGHGCTASTFWDHVYYVCTTGRRGDDEAPQACDTRMGGARLATVEHSTELSVLAARTPEDAWVALTQPDGAASPSAGWRWPDPSVTFGTAVTVGAYPWSTNEPNDSNNSENDAENCALINGADRFDDRSCDDDLDFVCENTWRYPTL